MLFTRPERLFSLVDCNNFYASCERVFAPKLERTAIVVLSNNDGCIVARSNEAKRMGLKMGEPAYQRKDFLKEHGVAVFSSNYALYGDMSERVMSTLAEFVPEIEIYSIDEAFLDLTFHGDGDPGELALRLKEAVRKRTGIPVSIGVAPTKTLAKAANRLAKRRAEGSGVLMLRGESEIREALEGFPVEDLWGIGGQYGRFLEKHGIKTALQLRDAPDGWVKRHLTATGLRMKYELQGISCLPLEMAPPPKKGMGCSRTFREGVERKEDLREAIATFAARCGEKLRRQHSFGKVVTVYIRTSPFQPGYYCNCKVAELPAATNYSPELIRYALKALELIYKPGCRYKKAGVLVSDITRAGGVQGNLFEGGGRERPRKLMAAVDGLNERMGRGRLFFAAQGVGGEWRLKQERLSPCYTTRWEDLLVVRGGSPI